MRLRAALLLLVCFGWHLAAPCAALALQPPAPSTEQLSADKPAPASCWMPRTDDARDLVQAPQRQGTRLAFARVRRLQRVADPSIARHRVATLYRSAYPARRCLRRVVTRAASNGPPA